MAYLRGLVSSHQIISIIIMIYFTQQVLVSILLDAFAWVHQIIQVLCSDPLKTPERIEMVH